MISWQLAPLFTWMSKTYTSNTTTKSLIDLQPVVSLRTPLCSNIIIDNQWQKSNNTLDRLFLSFTHLQISLLSRTRTVESPAGSENRSRYKYTHPHSTVSHKGQWHIGTESNPSQRFTDICSIYCIFVSMSVCLSLGMWLFAFLCVCVCVLVGLVIELQWEPWQSVYTGVSENWAGALKYTSCGCKHIQGFLRTDIFSQESLLIERLVSPSPQRTKWIWPNNIIHW